MAKQKPREEKRIVYIELGGVLYSAGKDGKLEPRRPECFYKDDLCKAVCGVTESELLKTISKHAVNPYVEGIGFDMPPSGEVKLMLSTTVFGAMDFSGVPLLSLPFNTLYEAARKFRDWERHVHPNTGLPNGHPYRPYFEPAYTAIETAYKQQNEQALRKAVGTLVDRVIHL